jgi:rsbT co-antagonist protein RsbR
MVKVRSRLSEIVSRNADELLVQWLKELKSKRLGGDNRISESDLNAQAKEFLAVLQKTVVQADGVDIESKEWQPVLDLLESISRTRVAQGFSSDQTATFVFTLKKPLFDRLRQEMNGDATVLAEETWKVTALIDALGLHTVRAYQKTREDVINRQQHELLELSTPVVKLWEGVLALPMIGTLDSARTQIVMESLLQRIVETGSEIAIIDITGVPTVDTLVAQHLLKTVTAIRLMGADCIISGVRPQIAQTIVHLGVDLQGVTTKATLADALTLALKRTGYVVSKTKVS